MKSDPFLHRLSHDAHPSDETRARIRKKMESRMKKPFLTRLAAAES